MPKISVVKKAIPAVVDKKTSTGVVAYMRKNRSAIKAQPRKPIQIKRRPVPAVVEKNVGQARSFKVKAKRRGGGTTPPTPMEKLRGAGGAVSSRLKATTARQRAGAAVAGIAGASAVAKSRRKKD